MSETPTQTPPSSSSPITLSVSETTAENTTSNSNSNSNSNSTTSFLIEPQIGSGSGSGSGSNSFQNDSNLLLYDTNSAFDPDFGFYRPDFRQNALLGSVQYYDRHVFLCYKNPRNWPPRIEAAEFDRLPRLLSAALAARKSHFTKQTRLTICEGRDGTETSNGDVLIFPDMIRYRRLTHFDVDTFVEQVLVKNGEWLPGNPEKLKGCYIFVCCHGSRDRRCGVCGPPLVARFKDEVDNHGLQGNVSISPCSHVGGHKYAGNVIIFGSTPLHREVTGHWYGYVTPEDVPNLLEQHVIKGDIVEWLWRGQMGLSEDDQQRAQQLRIQHKQENNTHLSSQLPDIHSPHSRSNGCCQSNGNASCCQHPTSMEFKEDEFDIQGDLTLANGNKPGKPYNSSGKRKVCAMPSWFDSWEREDTYAALAVVCAAVSVGIAYSCYKQL